MPAVSTSKLLRRFEKLQSFDRPFGLNRQEDELDLCEFIGDTRLAPFYWVSDLAPQIEQLGSLLDMDRSFRDFTSSSALATAWVGQSLHPFLRQIILSRELALRIELHPNASVFDITPKILASLIVQDLYLQNAKISLQDKPTQIQKVENLEEIGAGEALKTQGNTAFGKGEFHQAVSFYTQAIDIDIPDAGFHLNRAAAYYHLDKYDQAAEDATSATLLDPKYIKAWIRRADSEMKLEKAKKAYNSYLIAIELSGGAVLALMTEGLDNAEAKIQAEPLLTRRHPLQKAFLDEDRDSSRKQVTFSSSALD
ncbi:hypothetical protein EMCG_08211 [[Emmonsia] crescens]|uniref:Uncharacterized protein n=1 Tax=[Emmonsia] crescens TaxID=73230 RepID=A0A0G2I724_9EURO|nr:hypothetical protein EMCG_08211 [Emmonsia crescens UAMH 3008]